MAEAGADLFTFHIEATNDAAGLIKAIKAAKMKVGIAIKPKTPVDSVFPYVADVDLILVMTVEPGFGQQHPPRIASSPPCSPHRRCPRLPPQEPR
jgi:ribulose-phosphate 3-epimerase